MHYRVRKPRKSRGSSHFRKPRLKTPKPKAPNPLPTTIGSKDLSFQDSISIDSYNWKTVPPLGAHQIATASFGSLRSICVDQLAKEAHHLHPEDLDYAPWEYWMLVWNKILELRNDTFWIYCLFAAKFGDMGNFRAHRSIKQDPYGSADLDSLRNIAILETKLPGLRTHRIENVFSNVRIPDMVRTLNNMSFSPLTILDLSGTSLSPEDYYQIFNFPSLIALNVSKIPLIGDRYVKSMLTAIEQDGKLKRLLTLRVCQTSVTSEGSLQVLSSGYLCHYECDHDLPALEKAHGQSYVRGTAWFKLDSSVPQLSIASRLPMALKLHALFRYFSKSSQQNLDSTLDIMFHKEDYSSSASPEERIRLLERSWKRRIAARRDSPAYGYFHNFNHSTGSDPVEYKKKSKKVKTIKADAKKFFNSSPERSEG